MKPWIVWIIDEKSIYIFQDTVPDPFLSIAHVTSERNAAYPILNEINDCVVCVPKKGLSTLFCGLPV